MNAFAMYVVVWLGLRFPIRLAMVNVCSTLVFLARLQVSSCFGGDVFYSSLVRYAYLSRVFEFGATRIGSFALRLCILDLIEVCSYREACI